MIRKKTISKVARKYIVKKIGLGCLFVGIQVSTGVIGWALFTDGITVGRLLLLAGLMAASYIGGSCHGIANRKIEELEEKSSRD